MFDKLFELVGRFIVRFNKWIIIGTIMLTVAGIGLMFNLKFENDLTSWVDKDSKIGRLPYYINERFGSNSPFLIAIELDDVFSRVNLDRLNTLSTALKNLPEVDDVMSLATVDDVASIDGGIRIEKLISYPLPGGNEYLDQLKKNVMEKNNYAGKLVSIDGTVAMVVLKSKFNAEASHVANIVKKSALAIFDKDAKLYFSGNPFLMNSMADIVFKDFSFLIPLVSLFVIGILFLSFRTIRGIVLPLLTVLFSAALTMGIMSVVRMPLNVLSSAVPVLLIAVGSAYGIHILNNYYEHAAVIKDKVEIVKRTISDVGLPVLMAGLTTIAGFASNVATDITIIRTFGIFTAVGVSLAMIIAILFIPAVLVNIRIKEKPGLNMSVNGKKSGKIEAFGRFCSRIFIRHRIIVIAVFCVITAGLGVFIFTISSKVDILGYFDKDSEPQTASRFISRHFGGFNPLNVYAKGDVLEPDLLKLSYILNERIHSYEGNLKPSGITDVVSELNKAMTGFPIIPETKAEVENLMFFVQGQKMVEGMITKENNESLVSVMVPSLDNVYLAGLFSHINSFIDSYKNEFSIIENKAGNPALDELMFMKMKSLLIKHGISPAESAIRDAVKKLDSVSLSSVSRQIDAAAVIGYCTGDESEILFTEDEASAFVKKLASAQALNTAAIAAANGTAIATGTADEAAEIASSMYGDDEYTQDDYERFGSSISMIINESADRVRMISLANAAAGLFPGLEKANTGDLESAVAPYLWKTIPIPDSKAGAGASGVVRKVTAGKIELTGTTVMMEGIRKSILYNQMSSIAIALLAVIILNWMTFGSLIEGIVSLVAIAFTIIFNFGIMGILRIPLDYVTAIIASVAIGTGIDYTIHFITRYTKELERNAGDREKAYAMTIVTTGKAIVFNAVSVGFGFAVLLGSNVLPMRTAGVLLAITMAISSLSAMSLLPAVLCATNMIKVREKGDVKSKARGFELLFAKVKALHNKIWHIEKQEL